MSPRRKFHSNGRQRRFVEVVASQDDAANAEGANRLLQVEPLAVI
jgi:hypothetical protein